MNIPRKTADRVTRFLVVLAASANTACASSPAVARDSADTYFAQAKEFASNDRPADAVAALRRALAIRPEFPTAEILLGGQLWRAGFAEEAFLVNKKLVGRYPDDRRVLFNWNVAASGAGETALAEAAMLHAVQIDPSDAIAHGELAFIASGRGDRAGAVRHMAIAAEIESNPLQLTGLAQMVLAAGDAKRARDILLPIVETDSFARGYGGRAAATLLAFSHLQLGDTAAANAIFQWELPWLHSRVARGETSYQLMRQLATIQAARGNRDSTFLWFKRMIAAGSSPLSLDSNLGILQGDPRLEPIFAANRAKRIAVRKKLGLPNP